MLRERELERCLLAVLREPLDRRDRRAVRLDREQHAALDGPAVEHDRAGTAVAGVAADVGASQVEVVPEEVDEQPARLDLALVALAVDLEFDAMAGHAAARP